VQNYLDQNYKLYEHYVGLESLKPNTTD